MLENLPEDAKGEEAVEFALNIYYAVRRYAIEPDFLAYLLLLNGTIGDSMQRDNRTLCGQLLSIYIQHFEQTDTTRMITKQKFFFGLREVLPNKGKEMWQDLVSYFPSGGGDLVVNYEWILTSDLHVLSPIVYALRLQHLDEVVGFLNQIEKA